MKKLYTLIIAASVCSQTANAQFTMLRAYHEPTVALGMNIADMAEYDSLGVLPNTPGQGQMWNFSAMLKTTAVSGQTYVAIGSGTLDALFAGATIKSDEGGGDFTYYKSDSAQNQFLIMGEASSSGNSVYSDPKLLYKWPITSTSSYSDTYVWSSTTENLSGTFKVSTTGTGTLMLVGGKTFDNVMQLTAVDQATGTSLGDTASVYQKTYAYYWSQNRYPLLTVSYAFVVFDTDTLSGATIEVNWLEAVGITDHNLDADYSVYPNPASNLVEVKLSNATHAKGTLSINSITGQQIRVIDLGEQSEINETINVSNLARGVYIVKVSLGDKQGTRKLIIE